MVFKGNYLRVSTPRTTDGVTPQMEDGRLVYKEDFLPLSALKDLNEQNLKLPEILKKKIEVVKNDDQGTPVPVVSQNAKGPTTKK
jgi:hypothetical protein